MKILLIRAYKQYGGFVQALDGCCHLPGADIWQYGRWKGDKFDSMSSDHMMFSRNFGHQVIESESEVRDRLKKGEFDLIIASAQARDVSLANLHPIKTLAKMRFSRKFGHPDSKERKTIGANILGFWEDVIGNVPVLGIDACDEPFIQDCDMPLFKKSKLFFKSNLPFNYSNCFVERGFWQGGKYVAECDKFRPFSLGISEDRFAALKASRPAQPDYHYDVFACFRMRNIIRKRSWEMLKDLQKNSRLKIMMPEGKISPQQFYEYSRQSRVTLSPEGGGWECARHYEAIACGSLPLMNRPLTYNRWHGVLPESLVYQNDFSDYGQKLEQLVELSHRPDLLRELTSLVEERFTWTALMRYAIQEAGFPVASK